MLWYECVRDVVFLLFPRRARSLSSRPRVRLRVGVYGWLLLLILVRRAPLCLARRPLVVTTERGLLISTFFTLLPPVLFSGFLSLHAFIFPVFLAFPLPSFPFFFFPLPFFFFALYRSSFLTLSVSSSVPLSVVHRASLLPDLDSYANCMEEHGAVEGLPYWCVCEYAWTLGTIGTKLDFYYAYDMICC